MSLRNFTVIYDGQEYRISRALDAQDAARMACDLIWNDTAGDAFDFRQHKPTRVSVRDEAAETSLWDIYVEMAPTYYANKVSTP